MLFITPETSGADCDQSLVLFMEFLQNVGAAF